MRNVLLHGIVCSFELYMLYDFTKNFLCLKEINKIVRNMIYILAWGVFLVVNLKDSSILNLFFVPAIYIFLSIINFKETVLKKIYIGVCYYVLAVIPEFIFALLANVNDNFSYRISYGNEVVTAILLLLTKFLTFILIKVIEHIHEKKVYESKQDSIFLALLVLPVATIILLCGLFYADVHTASELIKTVVLIGVILILFSNAFMFYLFDKLLINMDKSQKLEKLNLKSRVEKKYLDQIKRSDEEKRRLLHDINKFIRTAMYCIEIGDIEHTKEIFSKLDTRILETKPIEYSGNDLLNAILAERVLIAADKGVEVKVNIEYGIDFDFMDEIDMIAILGNLLDNAYEAALTEEEQGYIIVEMHSQNNGHFIIINIKNSFKEVPTYRDKKYVTRKSNKEEHGIGLTTVEKIVKKYNGEMCINVNNNTKVFEVTIYLQI